MTGTGIRSLRAQARSRARDVDTHRHRLTVRFTALASDVHRRLTSPEAFALSFVAGLTAGTFSPVERRVYPGSEEADQAEEVAESRWKATARRGLRLLGMLVVRRVVRRIAAG